MGHWFSTDVMMTIEGVAAELGNSHQPLALNIVRSTDAVIVPGWRRTSEFRRSIGRRSAPGELIRRVRARRGVYGVAVVNPPSTTSNEPVMYDDAGDRRNVTARASSSGAP